MPTFLFPQPLPIDGLSCLTDDVMWLGKTVKSQLRDQIRQVGLVEKDSDDVITITPGGVATSDAIERFVVASENVEGDAIGVLPDTIQRWSDHASFGSPARLIRLRGGGVITDARLRQARRVEIKSEVRVFPVQTAMDAGGTTVELALSDSVVVNMSTYAGVLWANLLGLGPELWRVLVGRSPVGLFRMVLGAIRSRSLKPDQVAGKLNRYGANVYVHPSAVVEGCVLMDNVSIGPLAVVRGCIVSRNVRIEASALVVGCVLGEGAVVQRKGWAQYSVLSGQSAVGGVVQLGVLGEQAQLKHGGVLMDQAMGAPVRLLVGGQFVEAPLGMIGCCLGERTVIGCGVRVAPGRAVPPDTTVSATTGTLKKPNVMGIQDGVEVTKGGRQEQQ